MKKILTILILVSMVSFEACRQEAEEPVPDLPSIISTQLEFVAKVFNNADGLRLTVEFSDGIFDYGLNQGENVFPYHALNFFISQNNNPVSTPSSREQLRPQFSDSFYFIQPSPTQGGTIVTLEQLKMQNGSEEFSCREFTTKSDYVGVKVSDKAFIFNPSRIVDTIPSSFGQILIVKDSFRIEHNRNHFNLLVDYLVEQP